MATPLCLPNAPEMTRSALRRWLRGRWALVFSHPDDFASYGFESDRWIVQIKDALQSRRVVPVGLATSSDERTWVHDVGGCFADLDMHLDTDGARFVAIVDSHLRMHRTFTYSSTAALPSPIDLAELAQSLQISSDLARRSTPWIPWFAATAGALVVGALIGPAFFRSRCRSSLRLAQGS